MATYKERVAADLDRWIAAGLVPAENRAAALASIPDARRMDAAQALAWVGGVFLGVAILAFIGANWSVLPRLAKFAVIIAIYGGAAGGAAWCSARARPGAANGLLTFAAIAFAGAIGLTGQIFDIAGDERTALYSAGVVAAALALAGRASGPAIVALFFIGAADYSAERIFDLQGGLGFAGLFVAAPAGVALAIWWRSAALAHMAAISVFGAALWLGLRLDATWPLQLTLAAALAVLAAGGRWLREKEWPGGGVFYGWMVWAALGFYVASGSSHGDALAIGHRLIWLLIGGALVALGRADRMSAITVAGVLSLVLGISTLMYDLGLGLMTASGVFLLAAILAAVAGLALRRRKAVAT